MDFQFSLDRKHRRPIYAGLAFFVGFPAVLGIAALASGDEALPAAFGIVALIVLPFVWFLGHCLRRPRLKVSATGVEVRGVAGSGEARAAWAQIESLRLEPGSEGLVLREPLEMSLTRRLRTWHRTTYNGARVMPSWPDDLVAQMRFLPIDSFAGWFEHGDLRRALREHAPRLMEDFEARRSAALVQASETQKGAMIFLGAGLVVVLLIIVAAVSGLFDRLTASARWVAFENHFFTIAGVFLALGMIFYAIVNLFAVRRHWRDGAYFAASLWLLTAVFQVLLSLAILGSFLG